MKIVITGGHFTPAYSVLRKIPKGNEILIIGRKFAFEGEKIETFEYKICRKSDIPFKEIEAARLQRKFTRYTLPSLIKFPRGIYTAIKYLKAFKPDVVVTFGGYVGLTVAFASFILRIPVVLHEQTQKAGLSSRLISKFASKVLISFESSRKFFPSRHIVLTGNPLRDELFKTYDFAKYNSSKPIIFVTGGSTGSHFINKIIGKIIHKLVTDFTIVHQTGDNKFKDYENLSVKRNLLEEKLRSNYILQKFTSPEETTYLFQKSSLVISRSGINTVCELIALQKKALLIPLPYGQINEQKDNAILYKKTGLGDFEEQKNLESEELLQKIHDMINEPKKKMDNVSYDNIIYKNAAEGIAQQVLEYGRRTGKKLKSKEEGVFIQEKEKT